MTTRKAIKAEIADIVAEGKTDCPLTGKALADQVNRLIFHKASPYAPRGASDAKLTRAEWSEIFAHRLPFDALSFFMGG